MSGMIFSSAFHNTADRSSFMAAYSGLQHMPQGHMQQQQQQQ
jgi:hypothetical protein